MYLWARLSNHTYLHTFNYVYTCIHAQMLHGESDRGLASPLTTQHMARHAQGRTYERLCCLDNQGLR